MSSTKAELQNDNKQWKTWYRRKKKRDGLKSHSPSKIAVVLWNHADAVESFVSLSCGASVLTSWGTWCSRARHTAGGVRKERVAPRCVAGTASRGFCLQTDPVSPMSRPAKQGLEGCEVVHTTFDFYFHKEGCWFAACISTVRGIHTRFVRFNLSTRHWACWIDTCRPVLCTLNSAKLRSPFKEIGHAQCGPKPPRETIMLAERAPNHLLVVQNTQL